MASKVLLFAIWGWSLLSEKGVKQRIVWCVTLDLLCLLSCLFILRKLNYGLNKLYVGSSVPLTEINIPQNDCCIGFEYAPKFIQPIKILLHYYYCAEVAQYTVTVLFPWSSWLLLPPWESTYPYLASPGKQFGYSNEEYGYLIYYIFFISNFFFQFCSLLPYFFVITDPSHRVLSIRFCTAEIWGANIKHFLLNLVLLQVFTQCLLEWIKPMLL